MTSGPEVTRTARITVDEACMTELRDLVTVAQDIVSRANHVTGTPGVSGVPTRLITRLAEAVEGCPPDPRLDPRA